MSQQILRAYICHISLSVLILLTGCASHERASSQQGAPPQTQTQTSETAATAEQIAPPHVRPPETVATPEQIAMASNFMWLVASNDERYPIISDEELIKKFQTHRATFEQLRQMIAADPKLQRVDYDWTIPKNPTEIGVSPERIQEYRRLLDEAGCHRGFVARTNSVYFISAAQGIVTSSRDQGFYYSEVTPGPMVENTLKYRPKEAADSWKAFCHIEGNWYICFAEN